MLEPSMARNPERITTMAQHISNIDTFTKECRGTVASVLGNKGISFCQPQNIANSRYLYVINGPGSTRAKDKYCYHVLPICNNLDRYLWLGASVELEYRQGKPYLVGASVIIFEGEASDSEKTPLLRAEWELSEAAPVKHAQPHWHVYAGRINPLPRDEIFGDEAVEFLGDTPEDAVESEGWEDAQWFHFAMSSQWHTNHSQPIYADFDSVMMNNWLSGCIKYTIEQIHFLYAS